MSILNNSPERSTIDDIFDAIGKEFGETISMVKAAEILELVDRPKQEVRLTDLGRKFVASDRVGRRTIFSEQVFRLHLFHIIIALLHANDEVKADRVIKDIASARPYDNSERVFQTTIAWGAVRRFDGHQQQNAPGARTCRR